MFADTVEYLVVSLPSPESYRVTGSRIMLRVVDWHQVSEIDFTDSVYSNK